MVSVFVCQRPIRLATATKQGVRERLVELNFTLAAFLTATTSAAGPSGLASSSVTAERLTIVPAAQARLSTIAGGLCQAAGLDAAKRS